LRKAPRNPFNGRATYRSTVLFARSLLGGTVCFAVLGRPAGQPLLTAAPDQDSPDLGPQAGAPSNSAAHSFVGATAWQEKFRRPYVMLLGLTYSDYVFTGFSMKMLFAGALTALTAAAAAAQNPRIANDVLPYCKLAPKQAAAKGTTSANAYGYCLGAIDGLVMGAWQKPNSGDPACFDVPEKAFIERETLKVVLGYADRHQGELTQAFVQVAARALREAWPCKTSL